MQRLFSFMLGVILMLAVGCWGGGPQLYEVTGTVKFEDGSVPQAEMSTITFVPAVPMQGKAASSNIEPDGSFDLWTITQGDGGALAGDYFVTLNVIDGYPDGRSVVLQKYTDFQETPLKATVKPDEPNHFDFRIEKP